MSMLACKLNDEEDAEVTAYCKARHFKNRPDFCRVAVFAYIRQNKPGGHRTGASKDSGEGLNVGRAGGIRPGKYADSEAGNGA